MHEIILFLQTFDKYKQFTYEELWLHIQPSYFHNQFKVFKDEDGKVFGFVNWAWVNEKIKEHYIKTGKVKKWNCGDILLPVNCIAKNNLKEIAKWCKNEATKIIGVNKEISWLRMDENFIMKKISKAQTKGRWLWEMQ